MRNSKTLKKIMFVGSQAMLLATGGSCLPDNLFADTAGEIVSALIVTGFNMLATGSGFQI